MIALEICSSLVFGTVAFNWSKDTTRCWYSCARLLLSFFYSFFHLTGIIKDTTQCFVW